MSGILGQVRVSPRDVCGSRAYRLNTARERLIKAGRAASTLTLADLEVEAARWETREATRAQEREAEQEAAQDRRRSFLAQLRKAEPGDVIGPDENGAWWQLTAADDLVEVLAP
jgi:hypothetical protein